MITLYVNQVYIWVVTMLSLKNVMRANAISCLVFGVLFVLLPKLVAIFLGGSSPAPHLYILVLGIVLIVNGFHLLWASRAPLPQKNLVIYFSTGDFIWVIGSIGLVASGVWITTSGGVLATYVVAIMVGLFGILQLKSRKSMVGNLT